MSSGEPDFDPAELTPERRWALLLGATADGVRNPLTGRLKSMDEALGALYDDNQTKGRGSLGASSPSVARWLGDIRSYFPNRVVQVLQTDAIDRLGLHQLLLEPEVLEHVEPDVHLVATLASLSAVIPEKSKASARALVAKVVEQVEKRIAERLRSSVRGALHQAVRTRHPRPGDIDWNRTITANLANWLPEQRTIVPERIIGYGRGQRSIQREFAICVDQSGSMASSVVYASIMSCVLAGIRSVKTSLVVYDTAVVDLSDQLSDPVDVIFGTQLGGGTDTTPALEHCQRLLGRPSSSVLILISDLFDANPERMCAKLAEIAASGVTVIVLLALSDDGVPSYDQELAAKLVAAGIPAFGCTPDAFPDLIAAAIKGEPLGRWAETQATGRTN